MRSRWLSARWLKIGVTLGAVIHLTGDSMFAQSPGVARLTGDSTPGIARLSEPVAPAGQARVSDTAVEAPIVLAEPSIVTPPKPPRVPITQRVDERLGDFADELTETVSEADVYGDVSYLLFFAKGAPTGGPLVTSGSLNRGQIGLPDTTVLFGNERIDQGIVSGVRHSAGIQFQDVYVEGSGFWIPRQSTTESFTSSALGAPVLARPFRTDTGSNETLAASVPGFASGAIAIRSEIEVRNADFTIGCRIIEADKKGGLTVRLGLGARYFSLEESLTIDQTSNILVGRSNPIPGGRLFGPGSILVQDSFSTENRFYGGQLVANARYDSGLFFANVLTKLAMGTVDQQTDVFGITTASAGGQSLVYPGGLLTQRSNIGVRDRSAFAVIPEVGVQVGVRLTDHITGTLGYNFLYISDVVRPGDQIDSTVSPTQIAASSTYTGVGSQPAPRLVNSDFWVQGITFGLSFEY